MIIKGKKMGFFLLILLDHESMREKKTRTVGDRCKRAIVSPVFEDVFLFGWRFFFYSISGQRLCGFRFWMSRQRWAFYVSRFAHCCCCCVKIYNWILCQFPFFYLSVASVISFECFHYYYYHYLLWWLLFSLGGSSIRVHVDILFVLLHWQIIFATIIRLILKAILWSHVLRSLWR